MLRKLSLSGMSAVAIAVGSIGPANAQFAVLDNANLAQAITRVKQLTQEITLMQQQYEQLMQTYQAIAHLPQTALNQLGQQLNVPQLRMPLPSLSGDINSVMSGNSLGTGVLGSTAQSYLAQNRVYSPSGQDFAAQEMTRRATSVAGAQAMASQLYQSAATHVQTLQGIEGQLAGATDTKNVGDLQARVGTEQAYLQAQQVQAQSLAMWQAAQARNEDQQQQENRRQQIDSLIQQAEAHGG